MPRGQHDEMLAQKALRVGSYLHLLRLSGTGYWFHTYIKCYLISFGASSPTNSESEEGGSQASRTT